MSVNEQSVFAKALEIQDAKARAAFLDRACAGDPKLRRNVESLLSAYSAGEFLESPALVSVSTADTSAFTERPGTVIGRYKLLEQIGEGGFGVVYMAEQQQPVRRKVALKVLKPGMDTHQVVARFEAERQALALMDHPHIAHVLDAGTTDTGRPYFVMELIRGIPITAFCDKNRLALRERLELFLAVCQAVQHAHQKGILHRDLKPSNVLVTLLDGTPVVKIIDFGIAKALGEGRLTEKTLFTGFAVMIGTPLYMSPEQAEMSGRDVDTRTDIYALGVLLYELLTGTTPFDKDRLKEASYDEIRRIIREEEPAKPSTRISTLGQAATTISANRKSEPRRLSQLFCGELDWIVMKALEKDRDRRYDTASNFAADVRRYLHDEPVQACPPSAGYRLRKLARKYRKRVSVAVLCLLATLLAVGNLLWLAQKRAETAGAVQEALQRASDLQAQNKWAEALETAQRAEALLQLGGGSAELKQRVQDFLTDLQMIQRLEDIRLEEDALRVVPRNLQHISSLYPEAFRDYGLDMDALEAEKAAEYIRARPIHAELAAALNHWAHIRQQEMPRTRDERSWQHLLTVARAADPDPWRNRLREVLGRPPMDKAILHDLAVSPEIGSQAALTLRLLASCLADAGAMDAAVTVLQQAQQWHPDDFWITNDLADYLQRLGQPQEALRFRTAALALRPQSARAHYRLGCALLNQGALKQAIAAFNESIRLFSGDSSYEIEWGNALKKKGALEEAIAAFQKANRLQPYEPGVYINWASALHNQGDLDEAVAAYDQAIARLKKVCSSQLRTASTRALLRIAAYGRAQALIGLGHFKAAEQSYQEVLEIDPSDHRSWYCDAALRLHLGDLSGYRGVCREMLARFHGTADAAIADQTAKTCLLIPDAVRELGPVLELADRAVTGTEQNFFYRFFLLVKGMADYRAGHFARAIGWLTRTLSLDHDRRYHGTVCLNGTAYLFLAMAHFRLGHAQQARQALDQAKLIRQRYLHQDQDRNSEIDLDWPRFEVVRREAQLLVKGDADSGRRGRLRKKSVVRSP